ncbi:helix-turn-helix transcriptional regulator [Microtetraspora niveoalba]|uniref:helix-turn-helix transcriptional regulator n=1 Tax=Microtetraspora niveoalba TaxID=46175 RepID=UPI0012FBC5E2|nr:response regulator transcription factor family protein [Microtetraspora niveoalba]
MTSRLRTVPREPLHGEAGALPGSWPTVDFPLTHQGLPVGLLTVAPRDRDGPMQSGDERALTAVARQAAVLAHAALLTHELRESRRALVTAREEERRRLRNDLHDGLGPALGAVMLKLAAAGNRLADDPEGTGRLIEEARQQIRAAVADIRRLVYGLRPPALDELGVIAAVQSFGQGLERDGLRISVAAVPEPSAFTTIRVAVADDHTLFRDRLRALFDSVPDMTLVGAAADGDEAIELAVTAHPAVLLMDIRMPGMNGLAATRRIRTLAPDVAVVMLTMVDDDELVAAALREGACGYVLKDADQQEMLRVVRAAARGELLFGASVARQARQLLETGIRSHQPPFPHPSERERAVLDLLAAGYDTARIAATLHLSTKTVRNYLTLIPRRLKVADRAAAVELARHAGLGRNRPAQA